MHKPVRCTYVSARNKNYRGLLSTAHSIPADERSVASNAAQGPAARCQKIFFLIFKIDTTRLPLPLK